jgi:RNA polymerase-interacting CarD/CdnL/TRCF family regulator
VPVSDRLRIVEPRLDLSVGAMVVYGGHGLGRVTGRRPSNGEDAGGRTIVLEFTSGLSVILPLERAEACLRPPADARAFEEVRAVLRSPNPSIEQSWQTRTQTTRAKIAAGDAVALAEVVRDAAERQRRLAAGSTRSDAEQQLYQKARRLLAAELAHTTGIDDAEAQTWIESQLERSAE